MPLRDDLLNPIDGDNPSGANLRYAPVFDKIKEARREDDDAPQGEWQHERKVADYKVVLKLAGETLATKTKDLQLAAWITEAQLRQEGFTGLLEGLRLIRGLLEKFWLTVYPEIDEDGDMELRAAPVEWVGTALGNAVRKVPITRGGYDFFKYKESRGVGYEDTSASDQQQQLRATKISERLLTPEEFDKDSDATPTATYEAWRATLESCLEEMDAMQLLGEEKFGNQAPSFNPLRTAVEEVRHQIRMFLQKRGEPAPAAEAAAEPEAEPAAEATEWGAAPAAPRVKRSVVGLEPVDVDDAAARLDAIARFLRQQDANSPGPYLLLRGYRWGELRGYGEYPDPMNLIPPSSGVRQNIRRLSLESNWSELLELAETAMAQPCGRAWLDLQRYVVRAAEESGYTAVGQAIRSELRLLLADLPALPTWTLMDDTPTANVETQTWLKEVAPPPEAATAPQESYVPPPSVPSSMSDEETHASPVAEGEPIPPDTFDLALEAARQGRSSDAIQMLADEIPRQRSGRARFQRKLQLAQICMTTGHEALAQPILEELMSSIDTHRLEDWEASDAVAHPLALLYRCLKKTESDAQVKNKLYARISRLDPVQALECAR
ncbi:MAG TPA: type VI secretion system protein TssA [Bryobacteraceae bacterium]|nr:type VI secretion system protein TssA [Bryobacteraceae bacterium]